MQIYICIFVEYSAIGRRTRSQMRNVLSFTFLSLFIQPLSLVKTTNRDAPIAAQQQQTRSKNHLMPVHGIHLQSMSQHTRGIIHTKVNAPKTVAGRSQPDKTPNRGGIIICIRSRKGFQKEVDEGCCRLHPDGEKEHDEDEGDACVGDVLPSRSCIALLAGLGS